jgi:hypothetical protein
MKRTKDGGVILEKTDGEFVKITKYEFERGRLIRDMIRAGVIGFTATISLIFTLPVEITIAIFFIMMGWRLKTGW